MSLSGRISKLMGTFIRVKMFKKLRCFVLFFLVLGKGQILCFLRINDKKSPCSNQLDD